MHLHSNLSCCSIFFFGLVFLSSSTSFRRYALSELLVFFVLICVFIAQPFFLFSSLLSFLLLPFSSSFPRTATLTRYVVVYMSMKVVFYPIQSLAVCQHCLVLYYRQIIIILSILFLLCFILTIYNPAHFTSVL